MMPQLSSLLFSTEPDVYQDRGLRRCNAVSLANACECFKSIPVPSSSVVKQFVLDCLTLKINALLSVETPTTTHRMTCQIPADLRPQQHRFYNSRHRKFMLNKCFRWRLASCNPSDGTLTLVGCPSLFKVKANFGRAMAQAVSHRPLTAEARVRSRVKSMWDLWWTKWHWERFFSELSVFPCQFHSTGAPLLVKLGKKTAHLYHRVAQKALRLWCVRSICCGALHHVKKTHNCKHL
jgi:hypothetical protein